MPRSVGYRVGYSDIMHGRIEGSTDATSQKRLYVWAGELPPKPRLFSPMRHKTLFDEVKSSAWYGYKKRRCVAFKICWNAFPAGVPPSCLGVWGSGMSLLSVVRGAALAGNAFQHIFVPISCRWFDFVKPCFMSHCGAKPRFGGGSNSPPKRKAAFGTLHPYSL